MRRSLSFLLAIAGVMATTACRAEPNFPLGQAAGAGDLAQVRTILENGTDPDDTGDGGWRALVWALRQFRPNTLRALLAAGADPDAPDSGHNGWIPLMHAIHTRQSEDTPAARLNGMRVLLNAGADPNAAGRHGTTPLIMAAAYGATDMVDLLLETGADPRHQTPSGDTALRAAVTGATDIDHFTLGQCQTATVEAILAHAPDMRLGVRFEDRLALRLARWRGCRDVIRLLT